MRIDYEPGDDEEQTDEQTENEDDDGPRSFGRGHVGKGGRAGDHRHERGTGA